MNNENGRNWNLIEAAKALYYLGTYYLPRYLMMEIQLFCTKSVKSWKDKNLFLVHTATQIEVVVHVHR